MKRHLKLPQCSRRRGSVFVLVVAILAVLALMTLTLGYGTKMELKASRNSADAVQARLSALTGVPFVTPGNPPPIPRSDGAGGLGSEQPQLFTALGGSDRQALTAMDLVINPNAVARSKRREQERSDYMERQGLTTRAGGTPAPVNRDEQRKTEEARARQDILDQLSTFSGAISDSRIFDESAKVNINAVLPAPQTAKSEGNLRLINFANVKNIGPGPQPDAEDLGRLIDDVLRIRRVKSSFSGLELANAAIQYRYGEDQKPGIAGVDDNGNGGSQNPNSDGVDNDHDLVIDNPEEESFAVDADGLDNNFNGEIDEPGESILKDGLDNDRNGEVDDPNEATDEPAEFCADIRQHPRGDDRPFTNLSQLVAVPGFTPEILNAIRPFLTVFSVSQPTYQIKTSSTDTFAHGLRQLDPNTARPKEIFNALRKRYPYLPEALLGQYTANIIDRRDQDDVPTKVELGTGAKTYSGFELTPEINEVFPCTGSPDQGEDGDDGQFVEIYNPHSKPIDVSGWRLEGCGTTVYLNGSLPSGGFLVITDDYNETTDPKPEKIPGQGSLYDIFGTVPTGPQGQIMVQPMFDLPNDTGVVTLFNRNGVQIDSFRYQDGNLMGSLKRSFQRTDPNIHKDLYTRADADYATPLKPNHGVREETSQQREMMRIVEAFQNRPFLSPLELLLVPTNYDAPKSADATSDDNEEPPASPGENPPAQDDRTVNKNKDGSAPLYTGFRLPYLKSSRTSRTPTDPEQADAISSDNLDVSVVDLFMPGAASPRPTQIFGASILNSAAGVEPEGAALSEKKSDAQLKALRDQPPGIFGRVNVNTASPELLSALPGMGRDLAYVISTLRDFWIFGPSQGERLDPSHVDDSIASSEHWFEALPPQDTPRWRSLSEFVEDSDIWGDADLFSRIEVAYPFSNMITFHSLSYRVVTQSLPAPSVADQKDRRPTVVRSERIIAGDRGKPETVSFRYLGLNNWNKEDKDIKFAVPADKVIDLSERVLKTANRNPTLPHYEGPTYQDSPRDSGLLNAQLRSRRERKGSPTSINQPHPAAIDGESHPGSAASSLGASEN